MGRLQVLNLAIITLLALDVIFIIILFSSKAIGRRKRELYLEEKRRVIDSVNGESFTPDLKALGIAPLRIFEIFRDFSVTVIFPEKVNRAFIEYFTETGVVRRYCRSISSRRGKKRSEAAINLGFLPTAAVHRALETALVKEKHYSIRVLIISSLIDTGDEVSIPYILQTLIDSPNWYKEKIYSIMGQFGEKFHDFLTGLTSVESKELKMVIIYFANYYFSPRLRELLHGFMDSEDGEIAAAAAGSCVKMYPELLRSEKFLKSLHLEVRKNAVLAAASFPTPESLDMLIGAMKDITLFNTCVSSIHSMVVNDNRLFKQAMARFMSEKNPGLRSGLASALSRKIDYLFTRMRFDKSASLRESIAHIIRLGSLQNTIAFMNENTDQKLEDEVCAIISESLKSSTADKRNEFRLYLNERLLSRLGLTRLEPIKGEPRREVVRKGLLVIFLLPVFFLFPSMYLLYFQEAFRQLDLSGHLRNYFYLFNYFFAYYGIALNSIYLALLAFSFYGSRKQMRYWNMKNSGLLFKKGLLPSISIIAPAFREESTIIESVNSLINLKYPDYEVIVVNDGSTDRTLETLIDHFSLDRVDIAVTEKLKTNPIRGIYRNRHMARLTVVDKANGGKADSLNAGINVSSMDYFCGIDADSLIERDSLLRMAAPFLDTDREIIATGGNILPVNGCTVNGGYLTDIRIPEKFLPRLQTMEYIRSFISGRVGWATIRCLLIISGAFGLFRKSSVIKSGGYLTGQERYHKDTVGEDMELVVRLIRDSRERGADGVVNYIFNANCWTEVPEDYRILYRQRDRWQRGLLDIMTFHFGMFMNPRYREAGLIAFPYFIIFEVMGPWIEAQGLVMFIAALAMGLLNTHVILLLFTGTILMGLSVSIISFYIMERGNDYFPKRDIALLILFAFLENFGIRQFFSVSRLGGYISILRNRHGWGSMVHKGFHKSVKAA